MSSSTQELLLAHSQIIFNTFNIILIIAGWWVIFWQQKKQLSNSAKMKIYEELYELKKKLNRDVMELGLTITFLPFLEMGFTKHESSLSPSDQKLKAHKIWSEYLSKFSEGRSKFVDSYLALWDHSEIWQEAMPELKKMVNILFTKELDDLVKKMSVHYDYLQNISIKNFDWETWNKEEIQEKAENLGKLFNKKTGYIDDFMVEVHNSLVAPILGKKKNFRSNYANLPKIHRILSKDGFEEFRH